MTARDAQGNGPLPTMLPDLAELYEEAPCGYLTTLPGGEISRVNRTFLRWTGYSESDLLGRRFRSLLTLSGQIYHDTHFAPLLRMQGAVKEIAFDLIAADGGRLPALVNITQRLDSRGEPAFNLLTVFNAADRRRYEQELLTAREAANQSAEALRQLNLKLEERVAAEVEERLRAEEALRQAQKMEAIGQLTGGVAHDFNNLLTVIIGSLDSMNRVLEGMPPSKELQRVRRLRDAAFLGGERAATLTSRLLAFARRQPLDPKPIDVNRLVAGLSDMLRRTLGETIALETAGAAGLWTAHADPNELERAIVNLAVNARDAMPHGGKLTIEAENVRLDDAWVEGLDEPVPPGEYVMIAVSDNGCGMDAETLQHVFEPFFTTKEAGKGTGLGLSQVYGFVRQSGGHVRIYSEVGEGSTVKLYLPRLAEPADETVEDTPRIASVAGGDETILLVEDHDALRELARSILSELGYEVLEAGDGAGALDLIRSRRDVDLLFTDVVLPGGMNGRELARAACEIVPTLKLLYMTGYTRNAIVHEGRLDEGIALVNKPFTYDALAAKVREVLDRTK